MKRFLTFMILLGMCYPSSISAKDNQLTKKEKKEGWILLFNGKNYDGWVNNDDDPVASKVEDGAMQTFKCGGYILMYNKKFGNFILKCDVKMDTECNSGIFLRIEDPKDPVNTGFEIQVATETGSVHGHGALYDVKQASSNAGKGAGEWDHFEIKFVDNQLNVSLNGTEIINADLNGYSVPGKRDVEGDHKFRLNDKPRALKDFAKTGYIGFQDHDHKCWYKNVKLLPLK